MAIFAAIVFFCSLVLVLALFTLKQWEISRGSVLMPQLRARADSQALHLKELMLAARTDIGHLPPFLLFTAQTIVHGIAVDAGHLAIWLGERSHKLADSVSHKRNFERGETKSEFLKKVSEHKNGNGNGSGLDTTE